MSSSKKRLSLVDRLDMEVQVITRVFLDGRMPFWLKLAPLAGLGYLVNPVDFPSLVDDLVVLVIAWLVFYEFAPEGLIREHRQAVRMQVEGNWNEVKPQQGEVIDGQFIEEDIAEQGDNRTGD